MGTLAVIAGKHFVALPAENALLAVDVTHRLGAEGGASWRSKTDGQRSCVRRLLFIFNGSSTQLPSDASSAPTERAVEDVAHSRIGSAKNMSETLVAVLNEFIAAS